MELCLPEGQRRRAGTDPGVGLPAACAPAGQLGARLPQDPGAFGIVPRPWREALAEVGRELRRAGEP